MQSMKEIPGYPGYFADIEGNVWGTSSKCRKRGIPYKLNKTIHRGGTFVTPSPPTGKRRPLRVSGLILCTFVSARPKNMIACHGIRGRLDDALDNIYWATPAQNTGADKLRDGTVRRGRGIGFPPRLNELQVRIIRRLIESKPNIRDGILHKEIAKIFGIKRSYVTDIKQRKVWAWLK